MLHAALLALALLPAAHAAAEPAVLRVPSSLVYPDFWHTPLGIHRGTPRLLRMFLGEQARFAEPMGLACARMKDKGGMSPQITAFGVNSLAGQLVFNPDMQSLASFGVEGFCDGCFHKPVGVAALPDGRVAVADSGNHRIVRLRFRDGRLHWLGSFGSRGSGPGEFEEPRWVALDSQGHFYVSDTGNDRVQVFDPGGRFLHAFGSDQNAPNSLLKPQAIAVVDPQERYSASPLGAIFVVDQHHGRIQKFSLEGRFLAQAGPSDFGRSLAYFEGVALDYYNNLWVAERGAHQLLKFDRHLQFVDAWGGPGAEDGQLDSPRGLAIQRHYGQVLVLEKASAQYLWIGADVKDLRFTRLETPEGVRLRIDWRLTELADVEAWVEDPSGQRVAGLLPRRRLEQGGQSLEWDGSVYSGFRIPPGPYDLVFHAEATYSSATYFRKETRKRFVVK